MNKEQIAKEIEETEAKLAGLRKKLLKKENNPVFDPEKYEDFWVIFADSEDGKHDLYGRTNNNGKVTAAFSSKEWAKKYAKAFDVFLALRACEGVVPLDPNAEQWTLDISEGEAGKSVLGVDWFIGNSTKLDRCFSPCFDTMENIKAAINKIGEENILEAMKTFAWLEE